MSAADIRVARPPSTAQAERKDKLQRADRDFLMRLVAQHGLQGAAGVLRALADEMDGLAGAKTLAAKLSPSEIE